MRSPTFYVIAFAYSSVIHAIDDETTQVLFARTEAACRKELSEVSEAPFLIMAFVIGIGSTLLFVSSIFVYIMMKKYLSEQLDTAERRVHEVMDAILVSLIPQDLLDQIAPDGKKKK